MWQIIWHQILSTFYYFKVKTTRTHSRVSFEAHPWSTHIILSTIVLHYFKSLQRYWKTEKTLLSDQNESSHNETGDSRTVLAVSQNYF